jgi:hypothetical protein
MTTNSTNALKAIPTAYGGHLFRSRLEARWAIYFDAIGWSWQYEPEGYELPDGVRYLPDFWFPAFNLYAEVKPESAVESVFNKALSFSKAGAHVLLLSGPPSRKSHPGFKGGLPFGGNLIPFNRKYSPIFVGNLVFGEMPQYDAVTDRACALANSARFEFGETPDRKMVVATAKSMFNKAGGAA